MKIIRALRNIPMYIRRLFRLFRVKNHPEIVWNELIKLHKNADWHFGQYDNDKCLETTFTNEDDGSDLKFYYSVSQFKMVLRTVVLPDFNIDNTHDIMILSSHFNSLLNFGVVRVDIKFNYVEFSYSGQILLYALYPGEIYSDITHHYEIAKECVWAFNMLINSGDDPVFVIAELFKRQEQENKKKQ